MRPDLLLRAALKTRGKQLMPSRDNREINLLHSWTPIVEVHRVLIWTGLSLSEGRPNVE